MIRERVAVCFGVIVAACILIAFVYGGTAPILASLALWAMWFIALHRFIPRQQVPQLPSGTAGEGFLARVSAPFRNWWTDAGAFLTGITGLLIFIVWAGFEGLPHPSIDPFTSIQISLALLAAAAVLVLWSGALLLGDPDDGVPGARSFSNCHALLRILIFLAPLVSTCIYIELGVPPGSSLWYNLTLGLILFVWFGLSLTLRKRWLWVWSVSFAGTLIILPPAVTYLQARAVFLALQPIVELNPSSVGCAGPALFAHISDIHAVAGAARTIDGDVPGNARLPGLLDAIASTRPPYLLVTGDVTDGGQDPEWKTVLELLKPAAERIKVILAPGNHDLSSVFSGLLVLGGSSEDPRVEDFIRRQHSLFNGLNDSTGASLASSFDKAPSRESSQYRNAQKNVLACFTNCETERISAGAFLTPPPASQSTQAQLDFLEKQRQISERYRQCFYLCQHSAAQEEINRVDDYWKQYRESAFPLAWIDEDNGIAIFSLTFLAVGGGSTFGTNAIGFLNDDQARRLLKQLHDLSDRITTVVVMQHYPITRGPNDGLPLPLWPFLPLSEWWDQLKGSKLWAYAFLVSNRGAAGTVLEEIRAMADANPRRSYLVLFGHRHLRTLGTFGKVILAEAPNVASLDGGFYLGTKGPAGETRISWCPWPRQGAIGEQGHSKQDSTAVK